MVERSRYVMCAHTVAIEPLLTSDNLEPTGNNEVDADAGSKICRIQVMLMLDAEGEPIAEVLKQVSRWEAQLCSMCLGGTAPGQTSWVS